MAFVNTCVLIADLPVCSIEVGVLDLLLRMRGKVLESESDRDLVNEADYVVYKVSWHSPSMTLPDSSAVSDDSDDTVNAEEYVFG